MDLRKLFERLFQQGALRRRGQSELLLHDEAPATACLHGRVFIDATWADGRRERIHESPNLIVDDASILVGWLLKNNASPLHGLRVLGVGAADVGWDPMNPPAPTSAVRHLAVEIARKPYSTTTFIGGGGLPSAIPTGVVDYVTSFAEAEAVGPWNEMALIGGNCPAAVPGVWIETVGGDASQPNVDLLLNIYRFPVINKPAGATFTVTWRITT